ncbi:MAG TPA: hypothetical protein DDW34_07195 [Clostridium sp.]|nr:hypothetical protein [Clostridium sp.]
MSLEVEARTYEEREFSYSSEDTSPKELFELFFERQNQKEMDDLQKQAVKKVWEELGDEME